MCDEGAGLPYNAGRAERLKKLCEQLSLDAILLITGFDGCYNLEAKGLVEWLCDCATSPATDFKAAAIEEGLFVVMPQKMAWFVDEDSDEAAQDAVCALDRLLADSTSHAPETDGDVEMLCDSTPTAGAAAVDDDLMFEQQHHRQPHEVQPDGKLSLLLQLHPQLRRVGIALGVEVLGGIQQQVPPDHVYRWPLLMAAAEQLQLPLEQLFTEVVDITPSLRMVYGHVDGTYLSNVLRQRRPLLTRAWLECITVCGRRSIADKLELTEAAVAAAITDFVSGCGCRLKPGQYQPLAIPPRVLMGTRTSQHEALSCHKNTLRSCAAKQGSAVLHATIEAADACSPLRVGRTVFFSQGAAAADMPLQVRLRMQQQQHCAQLEVAPASASTAPGPGTCSAHNGSSCSSSGEGVGRCDSGTANNSAAMRNGSPETQHRTSLDEQRDVLQLLPLGQALSDGDYNADMTDLFDLMSWYWAAVDAAWQCMDFYSTQAGATWAAAEALATQVFWNAVTSAQLIPVMPSPPPPPQQQTPQQQTTQQQQQDQHPCSTLPMQPQLSQALPQLQVQLFSWDGGPRPMPSGSHLQQHNYRFKTLRVTVDGVRSRSPAHPGKDLGSVLYMDSFVDVPALGNVPTQLINATLTHCPTYSFGMWGAEAEMNTQRVAMFRKHLQAESQAQAAALRRSADDTSVLRMQIQQSLKGTPAKGLPRRGSLGQQQQFTLLQQLSAAGNGATTSQQQQQQRGRAAGNQPGRGNKHCLGGASSSSCCGDAEAPSNHSDNSNGQQAPKRSCCGSLPSTDTSLNSPQIHPAAADSGSPFPNSSKVRSPRRTPSPAVTLNRSAQDSDGSAGQAAAAAFREASCWRQLGCLLVPSGELPGEVALILTGAMKLAVMDGPLYPHSNGLVFVSRPTKVHLVLLKEIEAVWLQDFTSRMPGYPDLGPCVVIKGSRPCCGLLPAVHMTDNHHIAIPLRTMSKACSQHWVMVVLPTWQAAANVVKASKGATAPWPLPQQFQPFYGYWLAGPRKRYMLPQPDDALDELIVQLDKQE